MRLRQGWHQKDLDVGSKEGLTSAKDPARAELLSRTWRVQGYESGHHSRDSKTGDVTAPATSTYVHRKKRQCL